MESFSSHSTKPFSSHYNSIQAKEFKEMQMHLRDSIKNELLRKLSNPCLLLTGWGLEFCCQWSKTKILILVDIETGY